MITRDKVAPRLARRLKVVYGAPSIARAVEAIAKLPISLEPATLFAAWACGRLQLGAAEGMSRFRIEDRARVSEPERLDERLFFDVDGQPDALILHLLPIESPDALVAAPPVLAPSPFIDRARRFTELRDIAQARAPAHWRVRPVSVEVELTHRCNLRCGGCAVLADVERGARGLSASQILEALAQLERAGVYCFSITGGEPFTRLDDLVELIGHAPVDLFKIQTNAGLFISTERAEFIIGRLLSAGYGAKNKHLKPSLHISLGMQTEAGVPLANVAYATEAYFRLAGTRGNLVLNVIASDAHHASAVMERLLDTYLTLFGERFPLRAVQRTQHFELNHTPRLNQSDGAQTATVAERIEALPVGYRCFNFDDAMPTPVPRVLLRADGTLYPCSCFGFVGSPGSILTTPSIELLEKMNGETKYLAVADHGLTGLMELVRVTRPDVLRRALPRTASICKVCKVLREPDAPIYPEFDPVH